MDECSDEEWDEFTRQLAALEAEALAHFEARRQEDGLIALDRLIDLDDATIAAHVSMQYAFLVGYLADASRYARALDTLDRWDARAHAERGRPFDKPFAGNAGQAMILYANGKKDAAVAPARRALEQGVAPHGPIPGHPELGKVGPLPEELLRRLIAIADMWDEDELGPKPQA